MKLHRAIACEHKAVAGFDLGHAQGDINVDGADVGACCRLGNEARRVINMGARALEADQDVGAGVLERLIAADLATEGLAQVEILEHHAEHTGNAASGFGAGQQQSGVTHRLERLAGRVTGDERSPWHPNAIEAECSAATGLVDDGLAPDARSADVGRWHDHKRRRAIEHHRDHKAIGLQGIAHQDLVAGEHHRAAVGAGAGRHRIECPVAVLLEKRHRADRATHDLRQPQRLLRGACAGQHRLHEKLRAEERRGQQMPADRLGDGRDLGQRQAAAAEAFRNRHARPAECHHLVPDRAIETGIGRHALAHGGNRRLVAAKGVGGLKEQRLLVGKAHQVRQRQGRFHGGIGMSHDRSVLAQSFGRPSTRSPTMLAWI